MDYFEKQSHTFEKRAFSADALLARPLGLLCSATGTATSALVCGELAKNKPDFQHKSMKHPGVRPSTLLYVKKKGGGGIFMLCSVVKGISSSIHEIHLAEMQRE